MNWEEIERWRIDAALMVRMADRLLACKRDRLRVPYTRTIMYRTLIQARERITK